MLATWTIRLLQQFPIDWEDISALIYKGREAAVPSECVSLINVCLCVYLSNLKELTSELVGSVSICVWSGIADLDLYSVLSRLQLFPTHLFWPEKYLE